MKKSDLKTGMIAETDKGCLRLCLGGTLISFQNGGIPISEFDKNLAEGNGETIIKVWEPQSYDYCANMRFWFKDKEILRHCELIWERKPEAVFEIDGVEYSESTLRSLIKKATND